MYISKRCIDLGYANIKPILAKAILKKSRQQLTICWRTIWNMAYRFNSWNVWCCKKMHCKFDIHQFIDRTYLRNKVRHIGFLPTALWKTNTWIQHRKEINPKIISFFKTKQQEFIHPLILSPTHANKIDENPKKSSLFSILFFLALQKKTNCRIDHFINQKSVKPTQPNQPNRS